MVLAYFLVETPCVPVTSGTFVYKWLANLTFMFLLTARYITSRVVIPHLSEPTRTFKSIKWKKGTGVI